MTRQIQIEANSTHMPSVAGALLDLIPVIDICTLPQIRGKFIFTFHNQDEQDIILVTSLEPDEDGYQPTHKDPITRHAAGTIIELKHPRDKSHYDVFTKIADGLMEFEGKPLPKTISTYDYSIRFPKTFRPNTAPDIKEQNYVQTIDMLDEPQAYPLHGLTYSLELNEYMYISKPKMEEDGLINVKLFVAGAGIDADLYNDRTAKLIAAGYRKHKQTKLWSIDGQTPRAPSALLTNDEANIALEEGHTMTLTMEGNAILVKTEGEIVTTFIVTPRDIPEKTKRMSSIANLAESKPFPNTKYQRTILTHALKKLISNTEKVQP